MHKVVTILAIVVSTLAIPLGVAAQESMLKSLSLKSGQSYASAKAQLLRKGWKVDVNHSNGLDKDQPPPYGFKEVVCGSGWDATCSARFLKAHQEVMLTLRPKKTLVLDGAWDDK
jgi:hypothetical protein